MLGAWGLSPGIFFCASVHLNERYLATLGLTVVDSTRDAGAPGVPSFVAMIFLLFGAYYSAQRLMSVCLEDAASAGCFCWVWGAQGTGLRAVTDCYGTLSIHSLHGVFFMAAKSLVVIYSHGT